MSDAEKEIRDLLIEYQQHPDPNGDEFRKLLGLCLRESEPIIRHRTQLSETGLLADQDIRNRIIDKVAKLIKDTDSRPDTFWRLVSKAARREAIDAVRKQARELTHTHDYQETLRPQLNPVRTNRRGESLAAEDVVLKDPAIDAAIRKTLREFGPATLQGFVAVLSGMLAEKDYNVITQEMNLKRSKDEKPLSKITVRGYMTVVTKAINDAVPSLEHAIFHADAEDTRNFVPNILAIAEDCLREKYELGRAWKRNPTPLFPR